jgi:hypothetical protein
VDHTCAAFLAYGFISTNPTASTSVSLKMATIKAEVERIVVSGGITDASLRFGGRISEVDNEESPFLTLLVITERKKLDSKWLDTARELFHYIRKQGFPKINIEIADMRVFMPYEFSPVVADEQFWNLWKKISDLIAQTGSEYQFMSLTICHMGKSKDYSQNPLTARIQIGAKAENRDYRPLRELLVKLLDENGWHYIAVLILRGEPASLTHCPENWVSI